MKVASRCAAAAAMGCLAFSGAAGAQVIEQQDFEGPDSTWGGWACNPDVNECLPQFGGGNPGLCTGWPLGSFWWVRIFNVDPASAGVGDLTRHGSALRLSLDVRVLTLRNFFGDDMDPENFPLCLVFNDYDSGDGPCGVYFVGDGMPAVAEGWVAYDFVLPDPTMTELPAGWGGFGGREEPPDYLPRLPDDRTYRSVLENVDEVQFTTGRPGYFYSDSIWEVRFDNVRIEHFDACRADYDGDGFMTGLDFDAYVADFEAGEARSDYDGDGFVTGLDFDAFVADFEAGCGA